MHFNTLYIYNRTLYSVQQSVRYGQGRSQGCDRGGAPSVGS